MIVDVREYRGEEGDPFYLSTQDGYTVRSSAWEVHETPRLAIEKTLAIASEEIVKMREKLAEYERGIECLKLALESETWDVMENHAQGEI